VDIFYPIKIIIDYVYAIKNTEKTLFDFILEYIIVGVDYNIVIFP